jgi:uncharacterized protein YcbX
MIVCDLYLYPLKSCRGIRLTQAQVTPKGLAWDRELMLVDGEGKFLSQRQYPQLARIEVAIEDNNIYLATEGLPKFSWQPTWQGKEIAVEIWRDCTVAIDQGEEVAQWLRAALALPPDFSCRLVRQSPHYQRLIDHKYAEKEGQTVSFADGYPLLLTATASLAELNRKLTEAGPASAPAIPMNRFRPNLVVTTSEPFIEGSWQTLQIGQVQFGLVKPCSRCLVTTTDQITGERHPRQEPLSTLRRFRQFPGGIMFGENMIPRTEGVVKVGERVQVLEFKSGQ